MLEAVSGQTYHGRHGQIENAFRYGVDYVMVDLDAKERGPALYGRNRFNLVATHDADHGGPRDEGDGADWVRAVLLDQGLTHLLSGKILLLAQPRVMGHVFNPVAFWLVHDKFGKLIVVIAEVNNTFGDRHSYLCFKDDLTPITASDRLKARKIFHVSPFQEIGGGYEFRFDISRERVGIWIDFKNGENGVLATFHGGRKPLNNRAILSAAIRRPFGSLRVVALIYWQALKLKLKGADYLSRPEPPKEEITR